MFCKGSNLFCCPTASFLHVSVPFCHGAMLEEGERALGIVPPVSAEWAALVNAHNAVFSSAASAKLSWHASS